MRLQRVLSEYFTLDELQVLAANVGCRWDDLAGDTLPMKAVALANWAQRNEQLYQLTQAVIDARPLADWRGNV